MHQSGGDLKYAIMDEPLYLSHRYNKQKPCQWSISEVTSKVAVEIGTFQWVFPSAQVSDVELVATSDAGWVNEIMRSTQQPEQRIWSSRG